MENAEQAPQTIKEWLYDHELLIHVEVDREDDKYYVFSSKYNPSSGFSGNTLQEAVDAFMFYVADEYGLEV